MNSSINLILDGNNILHRAYHVIKNKKLVENVDTSSVEHWFRMVKGYKESFNPDNIYVTWDKRKNKDGKNFRKELVAYKANRVTDEIVSARIHSTTDVIITLCDNLGIKTILPNDLEGDDVIYFLSNNMEGKNVVVSGDKDLFQLVSKNTSVYNTNKNEIISLDNFEELVGIPHKNYIDYKCILGDPSDNISGLYKYGPIKAKRLAISENWGSLNDDQIKVLETNRILIDLSYGPKKNSGEWHSYEEQLKVEEKFSREEVLEICKLYDLQNLKKQILEWEMIYNKKELENLLLDF